jgi:phage shock protein PspC (stress-responsive transcriptional regulator)
MTLSEELARLESLRQSGALNEAEFAQAKRRLLDDVPAGTGSTSAGATISGFRRSATDSWMGGVCGGLGRSTGTESWIWRLMFTLFFLLGGAGLLLYILLWFFVPVAAAPLSEAQRLAS